MSKKNIATQAIDNSILFNKLNETVMGGYECKDNNLADDYLSSESVACDYTDDLELWTMSDGSGIIRLIDTDFNEHYIIHNVDLLNLTDFK